MTNKIIIYNASNAWKGGLVLSRPIDFPTSMFLSCGVEFENWSSDKVYNDDDIIFAGWKEYLDDNLYEKFKNNRIIVGAQEAFADQFKEAYTEDSRIFFIYSDIGKSEKSNMIHFSQYWWLVSYFHYTQIYNVPFNNNQLLPSKKFLMPCRTTTPHRSWRLEVFGALVDHLKDSIISRYDLGIKLPSTDIKTYDDFELLSLMHNDFEWYKNTHFSIVLETYIEPKISAFITEKLFKPISVGHPFMVVGTPGYLQCLKSFGFETYENLFDESYDTILYRNKDFWEKLKIIKNNVDTYDYSKVYDNITLEKLLYNRNRFFDETYLKTCYADNLMQPVLNWIKHG